MLGYSLYIRPVCIGMTVLMIRFKFTYRMSWVLGDPIKLNFMLF